MILLVVSGGVAEISREGGFVPASNTSLADQGTGLGAGGGDPVFAIKGFLYYFFAVLILVMLFVLTLGDGGLIRNKRFNMYPLFGAVICGLVGLILSSFFYSEAVISLNVFAFPVLVGGFVGMLVGRYVGRMRGTRRWIYINMVVGMLSCVLVVGGVFVVQSGFLNSISLTDWGHSRVLLVKENSGTTLVDFPVRVKLDSAGFDFSKAASDGSDVRFTGGLGEKLDYWIERWDSAGGEAVVWVKIPLLPANEGKEIRMYYGNPKARSESDGERVFEFFDDFGDGVYEGRWTVLGGAWSEGGGMMKQNANVGRVAAYAGGVSLSDDIVLESKCRTTGNNEFGVAARLSDLSNYWAQVLHASSDSMGVYVKSDGVVYHDTGFSMPVNGYVWYILRGTIHGGNITAEFFDVNWNFLGSVNVGDSHKGTGDRVALLCNYPAEWDWIRVRSYAPNVPSVLFYGDEKPLQVYSNPSPDQMDLKGLSPDLEWLFIPFLAIMGLVLKTPFRGVFSTIILSIFVFFFLTTLLLGAGGSVASTVFKVPIFIAMVFAWAGYGIFDFASRRGSGSYHWLDEDATRDYDDDTRVY